jgi:hypothetical protein
MKKRNAYIILLGKPEGKRPLERPRSKWEVDLRVIGWSSIDWMDWIDPAKDRDPLVLL